MKGHTELLKSRAAASMAAHLFMACKRALPKSKQAVHQDASRKLLHGTWRMQLHLAGCTHQDIPQEGSSVTWRRNSLRPSSLGSCQLALTLARGEGAGQVEVLGLHLWSQSAVGHCRQAAQARVICRKLMHRSVWGARPGRGAKQHHCTAGRAHGAATAAADMAAVISTGLVAHRRC